MQPRKILTYAAAAVAAVQLFCACNTRGCTEGRACIPVAGFYDMATKKAVVPDSLAIHADGIPGDSLILAPDQKASQTYLPLTPGRTQIKWCIRYAAKVYAALPCDTLVIDYTSEPWFASEDCGAMYRYTITGVRHTAVFIDSVAVTQPQVTNIEVQNLQIFFRTTADPDDTSQEEGGVL